MKRTYLTPTIQWHYVDSAPLLITVSTGSTASTPPLTPDDGDGDASEALVKSSFESEDWEW